MEVSAMFWYVVQRPVKPVKTFECIEKLPLFPSDNCLNGLLLVDDYDHNPHLNVLSYYLLTHPSTLAGRRRLQLEVWRAEVFKPI